MSREGSEIMIATYAMHRLWSEWIRETWQRWKGKGCSCDSALVLSIYWKEHENHRCSRLSAVYSLSSEKAGICTDAKRLQDTGENVQQGLSTFSISYHMSTAERAGWQIFFQLLVATTAFAWSVASQRVVGAWRQQHCHRSVERLQWNKGSELWGW